MLATDSCSAVRQTVESGPTQSDPCQPIIYLEFRYGSDGCNTLPLDSSLQKSDHILEKHMPFNCLALKSPRIACVLLITSLVLLGLGCKGSGSGPGSGGAINLQGAGATFPNPLYQKWISEYGKLHPNVLIDYQSIGSGGGIKQIQAQTVDFGASD